MKKTVWLLWLAIFISLVSCDLFAQGDGNKFTKKATGQAQLVQDGKEKMWCPVCGMNLKMFYKTSHAAQHQDGKNRQYCSMRCLLVDMQDHDIDLKTIKVVDLKSEKLIDAITAYYVIGSKVSGTMTKVSKLAFAEKEDAQAFVDKMGGEIVNFDTALAAAKKSLKSDIAMVNKKKAKKMYPMGKKIFEQKCDKNINPNKYAQINELKADIKSNKLCGDLNHPKKFQAVALYLWEVKRASGKKVDAGVIKVGKDEKCPVCGMFVYKYPRWAAQILYQHDGHEHHLSFDGVKDLMKFYFEPEKWGNYKDFKEKISKIRVTDYYAQKAINGKTAFYVLGSDIFGPMGNELIPFEFESDAKTFERDHKGTKIIKFEQMTIEEIYSLDQ